jgi:hypothetical protein
MEFTVDRRLEKKKPIEFFKRIVAFGVRRLGEKKPIEFWI